MTNIKQYYKKTISTKYHNTLKLTYHFTDNAMLFKDLEDIFKIPDPSKEFVVILFFCAQVRRLFLTTQSISIYYFMDVAPYFNVRYLLSNPHSLLLDEITDQ